MFSFEENLLTQGHKVLSRKKVLGAAHSADFVILTCTVLIKFKGVPDGRAGRQIPRRWLRHTRHYMLSRVIINSRNYDNISNITHY